MVLLCRAVRGDQTVWCCCPWRTAPVAWRHFLSPRRLTPAVSISVPSAKEQYGQDGEELGQCFRLRAGQHSLGCKPVATLATGRAWEELPCAWPQGEKNYPTTCSTGQASLASHPILSGCPLDNRLENWTERESRDTWDGKLLQQ